MAPVREVSAAVHAANDLTARWCQAVPPGEFTLSGAGLWPLLALLASAATGDARVELAEAAVIPADTAQRGAVELISVIDGAEAASAALGLWLRHGLTVRDAAWEAALPPGAVGPLAGQAQLDAWAAKHTQGLIEAFPLHVTDRDALVIATALAVKTRWRKLFEPRQMSWLGTTISGLTRTTGDLDDVALLANDVTRVVVTGVDDVDVHVLIGPDNTGPGIVLHAGIAALAGAPIRPIADLPTGATAAGLVVRSVHDTADAVRLTLPPFDIRSRHDLCATPALFGLTTAMRSTGGQFPTLHELLYISSGAQDVMARFSWQGFEAAAVTAFAMRAAAMRIPPKSTARLIDVTLDRPFGFLATHRPSGLVIVAGWVQSP